MKFIKKAFRKILSLPRISASTGSLVPDPDSLLPIKIAIQASSLPFNPDLDLQSPPKASPDDIAGRFREIISDPLNSLIERHPLAGYIDGSRVILHNGLRVPLVGAGAYYADFSGILLFNRGVHEPLEEFVFQEVLKVLPDDPTMLELGAYWGHYSMWMKCLKPLSRVVMVEPDRDNLNAGIKNFEYNALIGEFIRDFVSEDGFSVDRFMDQSGIGHLSILHADVQGYEVEMLNCSANSLQGRKVDYVMISTHDQLLHEKCVCKLQGYGYRVEVSSGFDSETTSFDGFLLAVNPSLPSLFSDLMPMGRVDLSSSRPRDVLGYLNRVSRLLPN